MWLNFPLCPPPSPCSLTSHQFLSHSEEVLPIDTIKQSGCKGPCQSWIVCVQQCFHVFPWRLLNRSPRDHRLQFKLLLHFLVQRFKSQELCIAEHLQAKIQAITCCFLHRGWWTETSVVNESPKPGSKWHLLWQIAQSLCVLTGGSLQVARQQYLLMKCLKVKNMWSFSWELVLSFTV